MGIVQLVVSPMANLTAMDCKRRVASFNIDIHSLSSPYCQDFISLCLHAKGEGDIVFWVWISLASGFVEAFLHAR